MKKIILIILIFQILKFENCGAGCLKCKFKADQQECIICDSANLYIKKDLTCIQQNDIQNCIYLSQDGKCLYCDSKYYLDQETNKCVAVDQSKSIEKCLYYDQKQLCLICQEDYKFQKGRCVVVQQKVSNCEFYDSFEQCVQCKSTYILTTDKQCNKGSECTIYNEVQCLECEKGYILNKNYYFDQLFDISNVEKRSNIVTFMQKYYSKTFYIQNYSVCQPLQIQFCLEYLTAKKCSKCVQQYFVNDYFQCEPYPSAAISFCEIYFSNKVCKKCNQKYLLQNGICKAGNIIENCVLYDGTTATQVCLQCDIDYFLSNNFCQIRKNAGITNCMNYTISQDECQKCQGDYVLSLDGLRCFEPIQGCEKNGYQSAFSNFSQIQCTQCQQGYFINENNTCSIGQINKCANYLSQNQCSKCVQGFYLDQGVCQEHSKMDNCIEYDPFVKNVCLKCNSSTFNFKIQKSCQEFEEISFCEEYSFDSQITCQRCQKNYYLKDGKCSKILISNCQTFDNITGQCIYCTEQYALHNNKCYKAYSFISENCSEVDYQIQIQDVTCKACVKDSEPLKMNERFACIENSLLSLKNIVEVQNCLKYQKLEGQQQCVQCGNEKYLENGLCKETCSQYYRVQVEQEGDSNRVHGYNICEADTNKPNCQIFSIDVNSIQYQKICILCKPESFNFVDISKISFSNVNPLETQAPYIISEASVNSEVQCEVKTNLVNNQDENISFKSTENCQYYYNYKFTVPIESVPTQQTFKSCLKCEFGYTGKIIQNTSFHNKYYISQCTSMTNLTQNSCTTTKYYNLNPLWQKFFTCHLCSTPSQIPVLFVKFSSLSDFQTSVTFQPYDETHQTDWTSGNSTTTLKCIDNSAASFGLNDTSPWFTLPQSCALAVMNLQTVDRSQSPGLYKPLFCAACKPGRKAINNNTNQFYITECTEIANCQGNDWFNACSQCKEGYVYKFINGKPDWTQCIQFSQTQNCYSAEILSNGVQICKLCQKGFSLNFDNHCISYQPPKCANSQKFIKDPFFDIQVIKYYQYYSQEGVGCSLCQQDYSAVYIDSENQINNQTGTPEIFIQSCVYTDFFKNYPTNPKIIQHCQSYSLQDGILICKKCQPGKVLQENESKCVSNLLNCLKADNNQKCSKCEDGYSLISVGDGNECQKGKIENCSKFNSSNVLNEEKCYECIQGFKLSYNSKSCIQGNIPYCETYSYYDNKCDKCQKGYALIKNTSKDYCFPIAIELSCQNGLISNSNTYGATFSCTSCAKLTLFPKTLNNIQTRCMPFSEIENCEQYDIQSTLNETTFKCLKCVKEYYLDQNNFCLERKIKTENCKSYELDRDQCETCEDKYFLQEQENQELLCIKYPDGISGCKIYKNLETCSQCVENMFIFNNSCVLVETNNIIENCQYYKNSSECLQCKENYIIDNEGKSCKKIIASNCLEYESFDKCSLCETGQGLKVDDKGVKNCVEISRQSCEVQSQNEPYSCVLCQKDTYQKNGECLNVQTKIENCIYYKSDGICQQCDSGYVILENGQECLSESNLKNLISPNCKKSQKNLELICLGCQAGYYFKNNRCQQCIAKLEDGCFACDPLDPSICYICTIGYQMSKDGLCIKNGNTPIDSNNNTGSDTVTDINKVSVFFVNFLFLIFYQLNFQLEKFQQSFQCKAQNNKHFNSTIQAKMIYTQMCRKIKQY